MSEYTEGPRACGKYELGPTLDLLNKVFTPDEAMMGRWGAHLLCEENRENMRVLLVGQRIVAHAGLAVSEMVTPRGDIRLGGVFSVACHPDFRRRGFGEACVRDVMLRMGELGCDVGWLGTGIWDWYRRFGWERAGQGYEFELDRGNLDLLPELQGCEVGTGLWPDLAEMIALHETERLGARRPPELWPVLLGNRQMRNETYTAARAGRLVAYAQVNQHGQVVEYAGEAREAAGLIREIFHRRDQPEEPASTTPHRGRLTVETPAVGRGLPALLRDLGLPYTFGPRGMLWIVNLESLLAKLGLAGEIGAERIESGWRLRRGAEQAEIPERHLAKLFFGPERVSGFAPDLLPVEFYHWPLDMV
jgi:GNAT superfamily N-acetyltransferase